MKRLNSIILGLLTVSMLILTAELDLSQATDKLLCTVLWCAWLVSITAIYLLRTREYKFSSEIKPTITVGLAMCYENDMNDKSIYVVLPFVTSQFKWTKNANYGTSKV